MELGTIQYNVEANTTDLERANKAVDEMGEHAQQAAVAVDRLGKENARTGKASVVMGQQVNEAAGSMRNMRGVSQQLGWQLQDVAVQAQMGTSAFVIFSQQGSQMAAAFGPTGALVGALIAVGGAIAGVLFTSLKASGEAMENLSDSTIELSKQMHNLNEEQQKIVNSALAIEVSKQKKNIDTLNAAVDKEVEHIRKLNEEHNKFRTITDTLGRSIQVRIDNTRELESANEQLVANQIAVVKAQEELDELQGKNGDKKLSDAERIIKQLETENKKITENTESYAAYLAEQVKADDAQAKRIVQLYTENEREKELRKTREEAAREAERAAEKARMDELRRAGQIEKMTLQLERQVELFDDRTNRARIEFDIMNGLLDVAGGLQGAEAQRLLIAADRLDKLQQEKKIADQIDKLTSGRLFDTPDRGDLVGTIETPAMKAAERIDEAFSDAWMNIEDGFEGLRDGIVDGFKRMLAEMAHEALTKPIIMNIQQSLSGTSGGMGGASSGAGNAMGAIGAGGIYAAAAVAVVAAVGVWNKKQDEKFVKMTAEYRQGTQSLGTILGEQNKKSESIANLTDILAETSKDTLSVNYGMYKTLLDIRTGIAGVASGFAKTLIGQNNINVRQGTTTFGFDSTIRDIGDITAEMGGALPFQMLGPISSWGDINGFIQGFMGGITTEISKAIYRKKVKVTDTGIGFLGQTLSDILETGLVDAYAYADINTKKKFLGVTTSNRMRRETEALDDILLGQFADVFSNAGSALEQAADIFGIEFDNYIDRLTIPVQDLSLKDLEGEELTAEIEAFFSSTLDNWAGVLVSGTQILSQFQQIGEGAFETVLRLASETGYFTEQVERMGIQFDLVGIGAIEAVQNIAGLAGGFDQLTGAISTYNSRFLSDAERFAATQNQITRYFDSINTAVPQTREQFKDLVQALDLTTISGQEQFAALMAVSGAVDDYVSQLEKQQDAIYDLLTRSINAEKKILDQQIDVLEESLSATKSVYDALSSTLSGMIDDSVRTQQLTRRQAQLELSGMLGAARRGQLPDIDDLNNALSTIIRPSENLYSTFEDYARDFYRTAGVIGELRDVTGEQMTTEEQMIAELESQSSYLESISEWAKQQIDAIKGVDTSIKSVAYALELFTGMTGVNFPSADQLATLANVATMNENAQSQTAQAIQAMSQGNAETKQQMKEFSDYVKASQLSISENTLQIKKLLEKFDAIGMPPVREDA